MLRTTYVNDMAQSAVNWLKRNADGSVAASGRVDGRISCHGSARANDFILTSQLTMAP